MPLMPDEENRLREELPNPIGIPFLASYLQVDWRTIYQAIKRGELRAKKLLGQWTIRREDAIRWLADNWN